MCVKNLLSMCFVLAASFCVVSAQQCGNSRIFTPNSTYDSNRHIILSTLAANVTSRDGFYNGSVGEGPGRIYALGMCIPGVELKLCSDCIESASIDLIRECPNQVDSFNWKVNRTLCFVRYSNRSSFFEHLNQEPMRALCNSENITWNEADFNKTWVEFMELVIGAASSSGPRHYAAKVSPMLGFQRKYAMMQCIPGLSSTDCDACLRRSVSGSQGICKGRQGSTILRPVCFFKWETFPYYGGVFSKLNSPTLLNPPQPMPPSDTISRGALIAIIVVPTIVVALLALGFVFWRRRKSEKTAKLKIDDDIATPQSLQFVFQTLDAATDKFSDKNKIGQGGFGEVYKGTLPNGTEIAVKRLSRTSEQGLKEFKNEVDVLAKLQHRNLVSILGFCLEGEEKILVYEFVPNKSLDYFLFDPVKQVQLDWTKRYNIIGGIVRGILYLHRDSRITIIHRDLKASNILLDDDMSPKIADFGMARIFGMEQTRADTSKIAGTYGYMAPEYAMHGQFSVKSDVYSFGVLVLEIITGKMNNVFYEIDGFTGNLITHAWRLLRKGSPLELLDPTFGENYQSNEVARCIHIALLCVQEDPTDRPKLSTVILMLTNSSITLPVPQETNIFLAE